jgi:hypothetical protein
MMQRGGLVADDAERGTLDSHGSVIQVMGDVTSGLTPGKPPIHKALSLASKWVVELKWKHAVWQLSKTTGSFFPALSIISSYLWELTRFLFFAFVLSFSGVKIEFLIPHPRWKWIRMTVQCSTYLVVTDVLHKPGGRVWGLELFVAEFQQGRRHYSWWHNLVTVSMGFAVSFFSIPLYT